MDTTLRIYVYLTCIFLTVNGEQAEREVDICDVRMGTRARLVHVYSPDFPGYPTSEKHCNCTVSSTNSQSLAVTVRLLITSSMTSLSLNYNEEDRPVIWTGYSANFTSNDFRNGGLLVTETSSVGIIYKHTYSKKSIFKLDIKSVNITDELRISCDQLATPPDDKGGSDSQHDGILGEIDSACSPYLVIILGGLCAAFFLITIALSIMLCCTVRKSTKFRLRHTSESSKPLSNQSSLGLPMESYRVASRIYDDGMANRTSMNGDQHQYPVPRHHSVPAIRESAAYMNTLDMNLYGNT